MGYNLIIALKAEDIDKLRIDDSFGAQLREHVRTNHDPNAANMERFGEKGADYPVFIGSLHHADHPVMHVIDGSGALNPLDAMTEDPECAMIALHEWRRHVGLDQALWPDQAARGTDQDHGTTEPTDSSGQQEESTKGMVIFSVLWDAISNIRKDSEVTERMARIAEAEMRHPSKHDPLPSSSIDTAIQAGNHFNAMNFVAHVPAGDGAVFCMYHNHARQIMSEKITYGVDRPLSSAEKRRLDNAEKLRVVDMSLLKSMLNHNLPRHMLTERFLPFSGRPAFIENGMAPGAAEHLARLADSNIGDGIIRVYDDSNVIDTERFLESELIHTYAIQKQGAETYAIDALGVRHIDDIEAELDTFMADRREISLEINGRAPDQDGAYAGVEMIRPDDLECFRNDIERARDWLKQGQEKTIAPTV